MRTDIVTSSVLKQINKIKILNGDVGDIPRTNKPSQSLINILLCCSYILLARRVILEAGVERVGWSQSHCRPPPGRITEHQNMQISEGGKVRAVVTTCLRIPDEDTTITLCSSLQDPTGQF